MRILFNVSLLVFLSLLFFYVVEEFVDEKRESVKAKERAARRKEEVERITIRNDEFKTSHLSNVKAILTFANNNVIKYSIGNVCLDSKTISYLKDVLATSIEYGIVSKKYEELFNAALIANNENFLNIITLKPMLKELIDSFEAETNVVLFY